MATRRVLDEAEDRQWFKRDVVSISIAQSDEGATNIATQRQSDNPPSSASSIRLDNRERVRIQLQIILPAVRGIRVVDLPDIIVLVEFDFAPI